MLGAGLGRWGMMRYYFGNPWSRHSAALWAELQFPAWILDGGIILTVLSIYLREDFWNVPAQMTFRNEGPILKAAYLLKQEF